MSFWTIEPDWKGQSVAVICGGTSLTDEQVSRVQELGFRSIVINSAYTKAPWADLLVFADARWFDRERQTNAKQLAKFRGQIIAASNSVRGDGFLRVRRAKGETGLATSPDSVIVGRTSLHSALNVCAHKGVARIYLLGADNRDGDNGRAHFHDEYPWPRRKDTWKVKEKQLATVVRPLADRGIQVFNCSPLSALPWWPKIDLEEINK